VSSSLDATIQIWDPHAGRQQAIIHGHTKDVRCVSLSMDGRILASTSRDGTSRLWHWGNWEQLASIPGETVEFNTWQGVALSPTQPLLATLDGEDRLVRLHQFDTDALLGEVLPQEQVFYANAKIVLLGDTGVGKTCLARALRSEVFQEAKGTYARQVRLFDTRDAIRTPEQKEMRQIFLWDLVLQR
jgi:Cdc6-like AAA superfamily ATPase